MLQLTDVILDEELGAAPFLILRTTCRKSAGETVPVQTQQYETFGSVHPAKPEDIALLPEEYRSESILLIHSPVPLSLGGPLNDLHFNEPDRILYDHRTYLVISVRPWTPHGFCKAFAVLQRQAAGTAVSP